MKIQRTYVPQDSAFPLLGLDTLVPSVQLDPRYSPKLQNMEIRKGVLTKRRGYQQLGGALDGSVIGVVEFETLTGTKILLALTTTKQYKLDAGAWTNITYQSAGVDVNWTGTETDWLDWTVMTGLDSAGTYKKWIVITNGKDQPRYWDGTMSKFARYHTDSVAAGGAALLFTGFVTARAIAQFYNYVILANVTTGAQQRNQITWSDTGDLFDFDGVNSGDVLLPNVRGEILKMLPLGDRLVIYGENSIHLMTHVGSPAIFTFEDVLQESRLVSARSIVNIGPYHLILTEENVLFFDGTRVYQTIGDRIYRDYRDELFVSNRKRAFAFHDPSRQHVYFNIPVASEQNAFYRMEYDTLDPRNCKWTKLSYANRPMSMGLYSRDSTLSWAGLKTLGLSWSEISFPWNRGTVKQAFPIRVFGASTAVFVDEEILSKDATVAIEGYWDSKDFAVPAAYRSTIGRWIEIEIDLKGFECDVYISADEGITYEFVQKCELTSNWKKFRIPIDKTSMHLRYRLYNNCINSNFEARYGRVWVVESGLE